MSGAKLPKRPPRLGPINDSPPPPVTPPDNLDNKTTIHINDKDIDIDPEINIETLQELGRGAYGIVERVRHKPTGFEMAVKRISQNIVQEQRRLLMDMNVLVNSAGCPNIVEFYGAIFSEGDLWLFMEIMDSSLDKFYRKAYTRVDIPTNENAIPESILGKIGSCIVKALQYLHGIKIIHRDVKPSNILISRNGSVKLCDFGISGHLVNSIAQTFEAGCKPYMAPERINPDPQRRGYDIRSDVWSLGISMLELAIGKYPFPESKNLFEQLKRICQDDPPRLPPNRFSKDFESFIEQCLQRDYEMRPNYNKLILHPFITENETKDISEFVSKILDST
ncbi:dual specificity mitogen-activated protein kinase kinase 6-like [Oppia nitens]|uniref:dual specificity mitogen-activated protein kinase kinase 6-like n=1 Tax=Oppia nitens TaxID=1686743 RepID=UPI0023DAFB14|nr:dual specificity mitogen-activated protein kinase kinase 6-like [Oppia nitens]